MEPKYPDDQQKVVTLLEKLSKVDAEYPVELLKQRRVAFLNSVSVIKLNPHIKAGKGHGGPPPSGAEVLLQSFLVIILAAEIAIGAYVLRDKWLPLFRHPTPVSIPTYSEPLPTSAFAPIATPLTSPTVLPTETPVPTMAVVPMETAIPVTGPTDVNPVVPEKTQKGDQGLHLGQTPDPPKTPGKDKSP